VVIAFSGHGTETHELVGHDTDPYDLARTTIPLTMLGEWCSRIPSRRLLIVLDCCFSGGMGAKALQVEAVPRDIQSVEGKLNQISGEGRVVLTASGPTQKKAWESPKLGHGFLSLHLQTFDQNAILSRHGLPALRCTRRLSEADTASL